MSKKLQNSVAIHVKKIDSNLDGIAKLEESNIKIPFTNVGDTISIKEINYNKALPIAVNFEILKKSENTKQPICNYYSQCGGCKGQHILDEEYINIKLQNLIQRLSSVGIENTWGEITFTHYLNQPLKHRRRAFFSVKGKVFGFKQYRSNIVINLDKCPLLSDAINGVFKQIKALNKIYSNLWHLSEVAISEVNGLLDIIFTSKEGVKREIIESLQTLIGNPLVARVFWQKQNNNFLDPIVIKEELYLSFGSYNVKYSPKGFLQATSFGEEKILDNILSHNMNNHKVLDLFCGFGGYSLRILSKYNIAKIESIDITEDSIKAINYAKQGNNRLVAKARDIIKEPLISTYLDDFDTIIINPPRIGAKYQALEIQKCCKVQKIILVYCSISSLVRDLAIILQSSFFMIASIEVIDQFIFSEHVEIVVVINRK